MKRSFRAAKSVSMFTSANTAETHRQRRGPKAPLRWCGPLFRGLQRTVLAQLLNGQLEIPLGRHQRFFTIHHAEPGPFPEAP